MAIPPSSNIPTLQDIQAQYRAAAERARGREFPEFDRIANLSQLNFLAARESANERAAKADMAQAAQEQDRGFTTLGGQKAGDERYSRDIRQAQLQADQSAAQAMAAKAQAIRDRDARADAMELQGTGVASQFAAMQQKEQAQMRLAQYEAAQRQLARDLQERLANAKTELEKRQLKQQANQFASQLKQRAREAAEQIAFSKARRGALGGGGGMTASYSTGASGFKDHLRRMGVMR